LTIFAPTCVGAVAAALLFGCGDSGEAKHTNSTFAAAKAAQERKLRRLQRELRMRQEERRERRRQARTAARRVARAAQPEVDQLSRIAKAPGFGALARRLPGKVGATIGPPGRAAGLRVGRLASGSAWSTIKVPIALAVLREVGGTAGLNSRQAADIRAALTLSDNDAAAALFGELERRNGGRAGAAGAVTAVLRGAGDSMTRVSTRGRDGFSPYGQTEWSLPLQHLFMSRLAGGCLGRPGSRAYVLRLMGEVSSDTWGLGSAGLPARWKGGWGPGLDGRYLVRQMGVLETGGRRAVVTLAAIPDDGSFETAQSIATSVARWLAKRAASYAAASGSC